MQAVGIQLLRARRALRAIQAEAEVQDFAGLPAEAGGHAIGVGVAIRCVGGDVVHVDAVVVVAQAEIDLQRAMRGIERALADPEQAGVVAARAGDEGLVADRVEVALACLHAERTLPAGDRPVHEFRACLAAAVVEHGADGIAFEFGMGVVGVGQLEAQRLERTGIVDAAAQFAAALVHQDVHAADGVCVVFAVRVFVLVAARDAVSGVEQAVGAADETACADPRQPQRGAVGTQRAVAEDVGVIRIRGFAVFGHQRRAFRVARDRVVAGLAMQRIEMEGERAAAAIEADHAGGLVIDAAVAQFRAPAERHVGARLRDAAIDHVDRAADRAAAVEQGGRPLQHFDLLGEEGFDRDRVVDADGRHIAGAEAVAQHLHARTVQAADDRSADAGAEVRRLHARQPGHGFAQGAGLGLVQPAARQHLDRGGQAFGGVRQRGGADFDRGQVGRLAVVRCLLRRLRGMRGQVQAGGGGEEQQSWVGADRHRGGAVQGS